MSLYEARTPAPNSRISKWNPLSKMNNLAKENRLYFTDFIQPFFFNVNRLQSPITQLALMRFRSEDIKIRKWKRKQETWATRHWLPNFGEKTRKSNYLLSRLIVSRWMDKLSSTIQIVRSKPKCNISCTRLFPYYVANLQPVSQHLKWKFVFSGSIWLSWKRHWKRPTHPTEESKLIIRYYRESMLGEAQGSHQNYTVKRLFEKDRNSREIKTKRSTRTGILNSTSHDEILVFCKGSSRYSCFGKCKKSGT